MECEAGSEILLLADRCSDRNRGGDCGDGRMGKQLMDRQRVVLYEGPPDDEGKGKPKTIDDLINDTKQVIRYMTREEQLRFVRALRDFI